MWESSQQGGRKTVTSCYSRDRNREAPQSWLVAHAGFKTRKKKRTRPDTRVQLRMQTGSYRDPCGRWQMGLR